MKVLSNQPEVVPQLVQQLQAAADAQVRQLAAVLLRKWIGRHWDKLPGEVGGLQMFPMHAGMYAMWCMLVRLDLPGQFQVLGMSVYSNRHSLCM